MEIKFERDAKLGEGGYGEVFLGTFKNEKVAVKRVQLSKCDDKEKTFKELDHENVVKLFHFETDDDFKYVIFQFL